MSTSNPYDRSSHVQYYEQQQQPHVNQQYHSERIVAKMNIGGCNNFPHQNQAANELIRHHNNQHPHHQQHHHHHHDHLQSHHHHHQHHHHNNHHQQHHFNYSDHSNFQSQVSVQNKRKEKARIAARARRSQEASIIMEMAEELHISEEKIRRIDKATIVKLAIDYIKAFEILCRFCIERVISVPPTQHQAHQHHQTQPQQQLALASNNILRQHQVLNSQLPEELPRPKLSTSSIFTPKTNDMDLNFLMIDAKGGRESFVLKPDEEILDEDDLTHLAPQAGEVISFELLDSGEELCLDSNNGRLSLAGAPVPVLV